MRDNGRRRASFSECCVWHRRSSEFLIADWLPDQRVCRSGRILSRRDGGAVGTRREICLPGRRAGGRVWSALREAPRGEGGHLSISLQSYFLRPVPAQRANQKAGPPRSPSGSAGKHDPGGEAKRPQVNLLKRGSFVLTTMPTPPVDVHPVAPRYLRNVTAHQRRQEVPKTGGRPPDMNSHAGNGRPANSISQKSDPDYAASFEWLDNSEISPRLHDASPIPAPDRRLS
jgi:hypothetical protein